MIPDLVYLHGSRIIFMPEVIQIPVLAGEVFLNRPPTARIEAFEIHKPKTVDLFEMLAVNNEGDRRSKSKLA